MHDENLQKILEDVKRGHVDVEEACRLIGEWPAEKIGCAHLDHQRIARTDIPEVIFGENKSSSQIVDIARRMLAQSYVVMATRVDSEKAEKVCALVSELSYYKEARMLVGNMGKIHAQNGKGTIGVLCAGTSDIPVAEEACQTILCLGHNIEKAFDVGVAGLHRLFSYEEMLHSSSVLIVVAGMEGALPSVVAGLVTAPVIAVPTSVGYGTGLGGIAALLAMLNSCAPGVAVVNIDNGFGAACMAAAINKRR